MIEILKYPYPYKAWLTISNDPDFTDKLAWKELNEFIFEELGLDWANSIFLFNYNLNLPNQVSLASHPEIAKQPSDTLHTWGDFVHAASRGFSREDAMAGINLLAKHAIKPLVWVDHSRFTGNLIHNNSWGSVPYHDDSSGNRYQVFEYTLDLVQQIGVRYIWDGELTQYIGQNRALGLLDRLSQYSFLGKIRFFLFKYPLVLFKKLLKAEVANNLLKKHSFDDGTTLYLFKRFGNWRDADILGLSNVISKKNINKLLKSRGVMVAYTHLGKTNPKSKEPNHIPQKTKECLRNVKQLVDSKELQFSSLSKMLDYLVLRDNAFIKKNEIHFMPDGIRFQELRPKDFVGQVFSFKSKLKINEIQVFLNNEKVDFQFQNFDNDVFSISIQL